MEGIKIRSRKARKVELTVIPGHYATSNSHTNNYMEMAKLRTKRRNAQEIADYFCPLFENSVPIDTILCMEGTVLVGAFMAERLCETGLMAARGDDDMNVLQPKYDNNGLMFFRENVIPEIRNKKILVLASTLSTGDTMKKAINCVNYYGGEVVGLGALFSSVPEIDGMPVHTIYEPEDIPGGYITWPVHECPLCKEKRRLDAVISSFGYSPLM